MYKLLLIPALLFGFLFSNAQNRTTTDTVQQHEELTAKPAKFKGGKEAMTKFINDNLRYPPEAKKNKIGGKVVVRFIVDENGKINSVSLIKGISKECDAEAIRLVKSMPAWIPARDKNNEVVETYTSISVEFKLPR